MKLAPLYRYRSLVLMILTALALIPHATYSLETIDLVVQNAPLSNMIATSGEEQTRFGKNAIREWYRRSESDSEWTLLFKKSDDYSGFCVLQMTDGSEIQVDKNDIGSLIADPIVPEKVWMTASTKGLFSSEDNGTTWTARGSETIRMVDQLIINPFNAEHLLAKVLWKGTDDRVLVESTDPGVTWKPVTMPSAERLIAINVSTLQHHITLSAVVGRTNSQGGGDDIYQWKLDGNHTTETAKPTLIPVPASIPPLPIPGTQDTITTIYSRSLQTDPDNPENVFLRVHPDLYVYLAISPQPQHPTYPLITAPGENQWSFAPKPWDVLENTTSDAPNLEGVSWTPAVGQSIGLPDSAGTMIAGIFSGIIRSDDQGQTWKTVSDFRATSFAHHPSDPSLVFAMGSQAVYTSSNAGQNWTEANLPEKTSSGEEYKRYEPSFPFSDADSWLMNCDKDDWITRDGGQTWKQDGRKSNLGDLVLAHDSVEVRLYKGRKLNVSRDGGKGWNLHTTPTMRTSIVPVGPVSNNLASTDLYISPDLGLRWFKSRGYDQPDINGQSQLLRNNKGQLSRSLIVETKRSRQQVGDDPSAIRIKSETLLYLYDIEERSWSICSIGNVGKVETVTLTPNNIVLVGGYSPKVVRIDDEDWKPMN
ncbi:hypothetical protein KQI63_09195 [bacterium]|nr:hypothetical protein [bacterium]